MHCWINITATPLFHPGVTRSYQAYTTFEDITERKQTEIALRASEEKYRGLMQSLDSVIAAIDYDGRFLYLNDRAAEQLGGTAASLIGKTMGELCPEPAASNQLENIRQVIRADRGMMSEPQSQMQGKLRWYRTSIQPIHDEYGRVAYAILNSTDIDDLKTAQQELLKWAHMLEERVKERTAEVQDLYENAPTGYHSLDLHGNLIMVNQTELAWLGYTREEMLGRPFTDFITPESRRVFEESYPIFKQCGWVRDQEYEFIRKNGTTFPGLLSATAIYDETGAYLMSRSTMVDNTERKLAEDALRESQADLQNFLDTASDLIQILDASGSIRYVNNAWCDTLGYTAEEALRLSVCQVVDPSYHDQCLVVLHHLLFNGQSQQMEVILRTKQGGAVVVEGSVGVRPNKEGQFMINGIFRDVTRRKQVEEALRVANAEMERSLRTKDEFLANMSHELRTPLNAILALSESLLEEVRGPLNERQQESLRHIEASGHHLLALINDILDLSKVEAGWLELQVETVSVTDICRVSLQFVKEIAVKKQLQLAFQLDDDLVEIEADPKRLKQMLVNLLSNAVKFTPPGGKVSLEVQILPEAAVIRFVVQDTGIGIAPEDMNRLFRPFTQLDSSLTRQHEGTGLGLALVRRLAELHGGSITVTSEVGKGSCFMIALPYDSRRRASYVPAAALPAVQPMSVRSALVVEDSLSAAEQLARYLRELHVEVVVHTQGQNVVEQAASLQPGIIFLDLLMPDQSGSAILNQLKANPRTSSIPVIIITVLDERSSGLAAGAAGYLMKPISREMLRQTLNATVQIQAVECQAPQSAPQPVLAGVKVLLAEDNEVNLAVVRNYLNAKGCQVAVARNGREALEQTIAVQPDVILMGIQMPEMDGLEAIERLRTVQAFAAIPIIALTALAMPGDRERCLAAGASEYLTKPVNLKGLLAMIQRLAARDA